MNKLLDWIIGKEPIATATGLVSVVTALLGVAAAFGLDITPEQIAAIGALAVALAGWLGRKAVSPVTTPLARKLAREAPPPPFFGDTVADDTRIPDDGGVPLFMIIVGVVLIPAIAGFFGACDALFDNESEEEDLGQSALVMKSSYEISDHEQSRCYDYECEEDYYSGGDYSSRDRERNKGRNRGAFSPGPFDDSPVDAFNGNTICLPGSQCHYDDRQRDEPPPEEMR